VCSADQVASATARQGAIVWRRLKPVLEELGTAEMGSQVGRASGFRRRCGSWSSRPTAARRRVQTAVDQPSASARTTFIRRTSIWSSPPCCRSTANCANVATRGAKHASRPSWILSRREGASRSGPSRKRLPRSPRTVCRWSECRNGCGVTFTCVWPSLPCTSGYTRRPKLIWGKRNTRLCEAP
jgi:hypothetical protein